MTHARSAFQEWRRRLEDLQTRKNEGPQTGWIANLHARVLRYFISRYDYQPLPLQWLKPQRPKSSGPHTKLSMRLQEENQTAHFRGEDYRELLKEIKSSNAPRKHSVD